MQESKSTTTVAGLGDRNQGEKGVDILIVDDEPYILRSLAFVLKKEGYACETARDGEEAIEKVKRFQPKVLFLDIMMPKKTGFEVCRTLKADPEYRSTKVIMLTAKGQQHDIEEAKSSGADDYVTKPFSPKKILEKLSAFINLR
jgi:two-component system alkaline phosphatase synthesis response regulator PhoP